jgi:hypothetical protein
MSNQLKTATSCKLALKAENIVLGQFVQALGLAQDPVFMVSFVERMFDHVLKLPTNY